MLGQREVYAPVPYFWPDQYDLMLQYTGHVQGGERLVIRGDVAARSFIAFSVAGERIRAAMAIGRQRDIMATRRLIRSGKAVVASAPTDEEQALPTLAR